jgi:hypothetical protein
MLSFCLKNLLVEPFLGEIGLFCVFDIVFFFKSQMFPLYLLIIVFPKFDPLTATGMSLYRKMSQKCQNLLILSLSGIKFSLY